jgi:hypothetical protein
MLLALDLKPRTIAAGEKLFNTRALTISNVRGLNDNAALAKALGTTVPIPPFQGSCTTCHDSPNVGNHSLPLALDIGTGHDPTVESDPLIANGVTQLSFPDLPIFSITGCPNPFADPQQPTTTPYVIFTTDPGKSLISGLCGDVGRTKGPILRGLAALAPYFHNGAARDLSELVDFYDQRFQMNLTREEKETSSPSSTPCSLIEKLSACLTPTPHLKFAQKTLVRHDLSELACRCLNSYYSVTQARTHRASKTKAKITSVYPVRTKPPGGRRYA